ncbi:hypothetical protein EJ08DRAFT_659764 [Tothia fuscella]|uniref:Uncharacterized protein n=1 Tax=Tothia fuscella TaxID=1048955 RepID=A0A9P4NU83_9PEZI|nr:hypothetical protein EJ08DRAFT_659764 [Tothia fuscella]
MYNSRCPCGMMRCPKQELHERAVEYWEMLDRGDVEGAEMLWAEMRMSRGRSSGRGQGGRGGSSARGGGYGDYGGGYGGGYSGGTEGGGGGYAGGREGGGGGNGGGREGGRGGRLLTLDLDKNNGNTSRSS